MPNEETQHYLLLGGSLHGRCVTDLNVSYQPLVHMSATGSGPFRHYLVAYHNSYELGNTLRDIGSFGFRPHRIEN